MVFQGEVDAAAKDRVRCYVARYRRILEETPEAEDDSIERVVQALRALTRLIVVEQGDSMTKSEDVDRLPSQYKRIFEDFFYASLSSFLLQHVSFQWLPRICMDDRRQFFDVFYSHVHVSPVKAFQSICKSISSSTAAPFDKVISSNSTSETIKKEVVLQECTKQAVLFSTNGGIQALMHEIVTLENGEANILISLLGSLPVLVQNRLGAKSPNVLSPANFYRAVCKSWLNCIQDPRSQMSEILGLIMKKIVAIGFVEAFVECFIDHVENVKCCDRFEDAFMFIPDRTFVAIVEALLPHVSSQSIDVQDTMIHYFTRKFESSSTVQFCLCDHGLVSKSWSEDALQFLFRFLKHLQISSAGKEEPSVLHRSITQVAVFWSKPRACLKMDYTLDRSLSYFLQIALVELNREDMNRLNIVSHICRGVQEHLAHPLEQSRRLGMNVAEAFSCLMDPTHPLHFDSTDAEDDASSASSLPILTMSSSAVRQLPIRSNKAKVVRMDPNRVIDLDTIANSSDDEDGSDDDEDVDTNHDGDGDGDEGCLYESDTCSDSSLEAFDVSDDELDLKKHQCPTYLFECIEWLNANDSAEKVEIVLACISTLVRKKPHDLKDVATQLASCLIRLEDKYALPLFYTQRSEALVALCACSPVGVVPYYVNQILDKNQLFQSRIDLLYAMVHTSFELSGRGGDMEERKQTPKLLLEEVKKNVNHSLENLPRTRRWGYRRDPKPTPKRNEFATWAGIFFYPLLYGYEKGIEKSQNKSQEKTNASLDVSLDLCSMFLAHFMYALTCFVECSGHAMATLPMAQCLLTFAWNHRDNESPTVRRQILYCLSRLLLLLPSFQVEGRGEVHVLVLKMLKWVHRVVQVDADVGCRNAGQILLRCSGVTDTTLAI